MRSEYETSFRTNFLRKILDCLVKLRWPPSLVAFSDPLTDLFHDSATCHNAMEFFLQVALNQRINYKDEVYSSHGDVVTIIDDDKAKPSSAGSRYRRRSILKTYTDSDILTRVNDSYDTTTCDRIDNQSTHSADAIKTKSYTSSTRDSNSKSQGQPRHNVSASSQEALSVLRKSFSVCS